MTDPVDTAPWPSELRLSREDRTLEIVFDTGERHVLDAEYLRVESPSAEVQGHTPAERKWLGGKRRVGIKSIEAVGNYAVRLIFDDGHDTGIYSWTYLMKLGRERDQLWRAYLAKVAELGLSRG